jgi:type IV secretory pathway component VirB8
MSTTTGTTDKWTAKAMSLTKTRVTFHRLRCEQYIIVGYVVVELYNEINIFVLNGVMPLKKVKHLSLSL